MLIDCFVFIFTIMIPFRSYATDLPNPASIVFCLMMIYKIGQMLAWWYHVVDGLRHPHFAPWLDPIAWMTPLSLSLGIHHGIMTYWFPLVILQFFFSLYTIFARCVSKNHVGAVSYVLIPSFPLNSLPLSDGCHALIANPTSKLYIDPLVPHYLSLQIFQFVFSACVLSWTVLMAESIENVHLWFIPFIVLIRMLKAISLLVYIVIILSCASIFAARGTPFTWSDTCGVVVIAMSPQMGYWDVKVKSYGYILQIIRGFFSICTLSCVACI
jgi:hypothetical protein